MRESFYLPEEKTFFTAEDAEQANASVRSQMRFMFLVGVAACMFFGLICYDGTSLTGFLIYLVVAGAFLYGLWKFNNRVENTERVRNTDKQILPAEELFLSEKDITWEIKKSIPEKIVIAWEDLVAYGDGLIQYDIAGRKEKLGIPRVVAYHDDVVVDYIEKYANLKKVVKERYTQGEATSFFYYEK